MQPQSSEGSVECPHPLSPRYLLQEKRLAGEQHVHWYKWGPRAEVEVDREKLLEFVADVRLQCRGKSPRNLVLITIHCPVF